MAFVFLVLHGPINFLPNKHMETSVWHARPCISAFNGPAWGLRTIKFNCEIILCSSISQSRTRFLYIYRVSHELRSLLRESVPYVKLYRCNPKHLYPKLNGLGDNGKRKVWTS